MKKFLIWSLAIGVVLIGCAGAGSGSGSGGGTTGNYLLSNQRMQKLVNGMLLYRSDNDDILPRENTWMDSIASVVNDESAFHSPAVGQPGSNKYGYAMNLAMVGNGVFLAGDNDAMLFDTTDLSKNATSLTSQMPVPPRYGSKNTIGYLDGTIDGNSATLYESQKRVRTLALGMLMYSSDYDDVIFNDKWHAPVKPYVRYEKNFHTPLFTDPTIFGYAFNRALLGVGMFSLDNPDTVETFFDSTILTEDALSGIETLPNPGRYFGLNGIAYADGHVNRRGAKK